ncbi:MAG: hypothetical protein QG597_1478 [Actinomycetota bacterium]|nr:hypothetical protein [Actinomycetota bacterium]
MNITFLIGGAAVLASVMVVPTTAFAAAPSAQAPSVTAPKVLPGVPSIIGVSRGGDGAAAVSVAPASTGSVTSTIRVTASPSGKGCTVAVPAASGCTVTGLTNGTNYTFTAVANGPSGASAPSAASESLTVGRRPFRVTKVTAAATDTGEANLTWVAGANGGLPITSFRVTGTGGLNCTAAGDATSCRFTGLTPGAKYQWSVVAVNAAGVSDAAVSNTVTGKVVPGVPAILGARRGGDGAATVSVAAAAQTTSATTSIRVIASPSGKSCKVVVPGPGECTVTGLTNGTSYTFTAVASGLNTTSAPSGASAPLTVGRKPFKVTKIAATAGVGGGATLTWAAGANGGLPITGYQVTGTGGQNCTTGADVTSCTFTGLTPGAKYQWSVAAVNEAGVSDASLSNNMTAISARKPDVPTVTNVVRAGDGKVRVTVAPGNANGAPITSIVVRTDALREDGNFTRMATVTCKVTPPGTECVITGLKAGGFYKFLAEAANSAGTSPLSAPTQAFQAG